MIDTGKPLPKGWKRVTLGDIIQLNFGVRITRKSAGTKYPVYGGGGESFRVDSFNRENEYVIARFAMSAKCVRYVKGKFYLLDSGFTFSLCEKKDNSKEYVGYFLLGIQGEIYKRSRGQAQKNLDKDEFLTIPLSIPSVTEQKRIVAKLDKQLAAVEQARQAAEKRLADIKLLPAALLREAFPAGKKLPKGWDWVELGVVCNVQKGRTPRREQYIKEGVRIIKFRDITDKGVNWQPGINSYVSADILSELKPLRAGMTLIGADAHSPAYIGKKVCYVKDIPIKSQVCFSGEIIAFEPKEDSKLIKKWIFLWLSSPHGYQAVQEKVVGMHLNSNPAKQINILLPSISEQKRIVAKLEKQLAAVKQAQQAAEQQLAEINLSSNALLRKALTP